MKSYRCPLDRLNKFQKNSLLNNHAKIEQRTKLRNGFLNCRRQFMIAILGLIDAVSDANMFCKASIFQESIAFDVRSIQFYAPSFGLNRKCIILYYPLAETITRAFDYCTDKLKIAILNWHLQLTKTVTKLSSRV